jgi:hypothetical protein
MLRNVVLGSGLLVGSLFVSENASAQCHNYGHYGRPVYQQSYRAPIGYAPVYRPVQVYQPPVYGYGNVPIQRGVNIGIGFGGGYPGGFGYGPGYGSGYGYRSGFGYGTGVSVGRIRF